MNQPRYRWLVLSHAFNMDGRAASHTVTDKLKHLKDAGIEVVVISGVSGNGTLTSSIIGSGHGAPQAFVLSSGMSCRKNGAEVFVIGWRCWLYRVFCCLSTSRKSCSSQWKVVGSGGCQRGERRGSCTEKSRLIWFIQVAERWLRIRRHRD